jgi:hypothetical protein
VQERVVGIVRKLGSGFELGETHQHCTAAVRDESGAVLFRAPRSRPGLERVGISQPRVVSP